MILDFGEIEAYQVLGTVGIPVVIDDVGDPPLDEFTVNLIDTSIQAVVDTVTITTVVLGETVVPFNITTPGTYRCTLGYVEGGNPMSANSTSFNVTPPPPELTITAPSTVIEGDDFTVEWTATVAPGSTIIDDIYSIYLYEDNVLVDQSTGSGTPFTVSTNSVGHVVITVTVSDEYSSAGSSVTVGVTEGSDEVVEPPATAGEIIDEDLGTFYGPDGVTVLGPVVDTDGTKWLPGPDAWTYEEFNAAGWATSYTVRAYPVIVAGVVSFATLRGGLDEYDGTANNGFAWPDDNLQYEVIESEVEAEDELPPISPPDGNEIIDSEVRPPVVGKPSAGYQPPTVQFTVDGDDFFYTRAYALRGWQFLPGAIRQSGRAIPGHRGEVTGFQKRGPASFIVNGYLRSFDPESASPPDDPKAQRQENYRHMQSLTNALPDGHAIRIFTKHGVLYAKGYAEQGISTEMIALGSAVANVTFTIPDGALRDNSKSRTGKLAPGTNIPLNQFAGMTSHVDDAVITLFGPFKHATLTDRFGNGFRLNQRVPKGASVTIYTNDNANWRMEGKGVKPVFKKLQLIKNRFAVGNELFTIQPGVRSGAPVVTFVTDRPASRVQIEGYRYFEGVTQ